MLSNEKKATEKQLNFIKTLDNTITDDTLTNMSMREASIMIHKLLKDNKTTNNNVKKDNIKPEHSLRVGDVLAMSWGYEQTNIDFFVVTKLCGKKSVRIKECILEKTQENMYSHGMARDVSFNPKKYTILDKSYWIKDQNGEGDIKRVCNDTKDHEPNSDYLNMTSYANAYKYKGGKMYESWYA